MKVVLHHVRYGEDKGKVIDIPSTWELWRIFRHVRRVHKDYYFGESL